ncbi:MAG TPA: HEAT repeat domain-containing protein [Gemmatimonadales bacterium]|nr:HEAT repeat domain-containing protein [Gemmatimonadales bacterium]
MPFERWDLFDQDLGRWGDMSQWENLSLALPPLDLSLDMPSFEYQWQTPMALEHLQDAQLELQSKLQTLVTPMPALQDWQAFDTPSAWTFPGQETGMGGALSRMRPDQGSPEDSMYRAAREALNRGEYSRASTMFRTLEQKYPRSRVAPAVLYWQAFALYRAGSTDELRRALEVLKAQQERYPDAAADGEAATLRTRLQAALAARGDAAAAAALRQASAGGPTCDKEDVEVRAEALNALAQINPPEARPTLKKVLARRDECSVRLRRSAVYILGRIGTEEASADLIEVAKGDPDPSVRTDAILMVGRSPGNATVKTLEQLFAESTDDRTRQAVLASLRSRGGPEARRVLRSIIERNDVPEKMRADAISQLGAGSADARRVAVEAASAQGGTGARRTVEAGDEEDAVYLRGTYGKTESQTVKAAIISAVARIGGTANDQWILAIARNRDEDMLLRREALSRLRSTSLTVDDLGKLFDSLSERELRAAVVYQLATRDDDAAVDKLIEIARSGTDPQIRRTAISALARRKDPRTTKLLLDLVERP